jgi:hypothetical protein
MDTCINRGFNLFGTPSKFESVDILKVWVLGDMDKISDVSRMFGFLCLQVFLVFFQLCTIAQVQTRLNTSQGFHMQI